MLITKEDFCSIMDCLVKQKQKDDDFNNNLQLAFPDSSGCFSNNVILWDCIIHLLETLTNDKYHNITWWIYEDKMQGRLCIKEKDGKEFTINNPEELFNFIKNCQDDI